MTETKEFKAVLPVDLVERFDELRGAVPRIAALRVLLRLAVDRPDVREMLRIALLEPEAGTPP